MKAVNHPESVVTLSEEQRRRYARNLPLAGIGESGQCRLLNARVLVVGAGGLGSPVLYYLAAAGVGSLGIADGDRVEISNLNRQILHTTDDVGIPKVESAARKLRALNPDVKVKTYQYLLDESNLKGIVVDYDYVVEATDSFAAKFALNDACVACGVPFTQAGILGFEGQVLTVIPGETACYRCVYGDPPQDGTYATTSDVGVLGAVAGLVGVVQATEAIKYLTGVGRLLTDRLALYDGAKMQMRTFSAARRPECKACGGRTHTEKAPSENTHVSAL